MRQRALDSFNPSTTITGYLPVCWIAPNRFSRLRGPPVAGARNPLRMSCSSIAAANASVLNRTT